MSTKPSDENQAGRRAPSEVKSIELGGGAKRGAGNRAKRRALGEATGIERGGSSNEAMSAKPSDESQARQ